MTSLIKIFSSIEQVISSRYVILNLRMWRHLRTTPYSRIKVRAHVKKMHLEMFLNLNFVFEKQKCYFDEEREVEVSKRKRATTEMLKVRISLVMLSSHLHLLTFWTRAQVNFSGPWENICTLWHYLQL